MATRLTFNWEHDNWEHENLPDWDSSGTVAESWYAQVGKYACQIDRFKDEDGGGYAYTVTLDGSPIRDGENEPAESFEDAEEAIRRLLADRPESPRRSPARPYCTCVTPMFGDSGICLACGGRIYEEE